MNDELDLHYKRNTDTIPGSLRESKVSAGFYKNKYRQSVGDQSQTETPDDVALQRFKQKQWDKLGVT